MAGVYSKPTARMVILTLYVDKARKGNRNVTVTAL